MNSKIDIKPEDYADDRRVQYLVQEWTRLTQAEKDSLELMEVDPTMKELAEKELEDITKQKESLMGQIETLDNLNYIDSYLSRIATVNADKVSEVCAKYLHADNRTVGQLLSDGSEPDVDREDEGED